MKCGGSTRHCMNCRGFTRQTRYVDLLALVFPLPAFRYECTECGEVWQ